jgi:hypothetical protein
MGIVQKPIKQHFYIINQELFNEIHIVENEIKGAAWAILSNEKSTEGR